MSEEFMVHDRRLFGKDGQINTETQEAEEGTGAPLAEEPMTPAQPEKAGPTPGGGAGGPKPGPRNLPPPTFPSLLIGLATSALINLGEESQEPGVEPPQVDLPAAKHAIDLLGVLKDKTRGNLESEEEALMETLLYDLRLKYVKASQ
jgi:hypothetical protein